uniref:Core Histone H2A/H2B/H3 domain-containing protein n=1 Tax=Anser brachyrhynchus TaxID=132585 RepID=A0A8B9BBI6_9AVES
MARVKQVMGAQAVPVKKTAKKSALKPSATSPAPRASALRKKLRFSRKRSFLRLPAAFLRRLLGGFGIHAAALAALQVGCEVHLLALLEAWGLCARHAKRVAVEAADVRLVRCIQRKRV